MSHLEVGSKYHSHLLPINVHLQNTQTGSSLIDRNFISFLFLFELEFSFYSPSKLSWCTVHLKDFYLITLLQFPAYIHTCTYTYTDIYVEITHCHFPCPFIHLLNKYLLNAYYVPDIVLGAVLINKTDKNPRPHGTYFMVRETFNIQDK